MVMVTLAPVSASPPMISEASIVMVPSNSAHPPASNVAAGMMVVATVYVVPVVWNNVNHWVDVSLFTTVIYFMMVSWLAGTVYNAPAEVVI